MNNQERLKYENEARGAGYSRILGVDEAGRGPMAGHGHNLFRLLIS